MSDPSGADAPEDPGSEGERPLSPADRSSDRPTDQPSPPPAGQGEGRVTVVGTAHVSQASVDEVVETIEREGPDVVAVELDRNRYRQLQGETPDDLEATDLLGGNTVFQLLAYWMLSYVQSRLGDRFDVEPGADMQAAIDTAEERGHAVALVDRDIQETMQRFWAGLTATEKLRLVGGLALGVSDPRTVGLALGVGIGAGVGLVVAAFVAPLLGFAETLSLGVTDPFTLQVIGAIGAGTFVGLFVGAAFLPSLESPESYTGGLVSGFTLRLGLGVTLTVGALLALVLGDLSIGPVGPERLVGTGELTIRGTVGVLAGVAAGGILGGVFGVILDLVSADVEDLETLDIEELTDADVVTAMMEEFRRFSPRGAEALIDERDAYIAHNLHALRSQGYHVVAVVGAGHREGIERYLADPGSLPSMDDVTGTTRSRWVTPFKAVGYLVMVAIVGFFGLLVMAGVQDRFLLRLFASWFLFNGAFAFTLARIAGARWSSAGVGGCVAWLTSINPLLAPGWFAGYVELRHRPVNVADIATLNEIMNDTGQSVEEAIRRMFEVPLFRLIAIVAFTNIGSMIATFLFPIVVLPWLAPEVGGIDGLANELLTGARNSLELIRGMVS